MIARRLNTLVVLREAVLVNSHRVFAVPFYTQKGVPAHTSSGKPRSDILRFSLNDHLAGLYCIRQR